MLFGQTVLDLSNVTAATMEPKTGASTGPIACNMFHSVGVSATAGHRVHIALYRFTVQSNVPGVFDGHKPATTYVNLDRTLEHLGLAFALWHKGKHLASAVVQEIAVIALNTIFPLSGFLEPRHQRATCVEICLT